LFIYFVIIIKTFYIIDNIFNFTNIKYILLIININVSYIKDFKILYSNKYKLFKYFDLFKDYSIDNKVLIIFWIYKTLLFNFKNLFLFNNLIYSKL